MLGDTPAPAKCSSEAGVPCITAEYGDPRRNTRKIAWSSRLHGRCARPLPSCLTECSVGIDGRLRRCHPPNTAIRVGMHGRLRSVLMRVQLLPPDQSTSAAACITCIRSRVYQGVLPLPIRNTPPTQAAHTAGTGGTGQGGGLCGAAPDRRAWACKASAGLLAGGWCGAGSGSAPAQGCS
ncbi:hypothetical protein HC928_03285 [bacterium]|nr:hypothetical protein [bacterium]